MSVADDLIFLIEAANIATFGTTLFLSSHANIPDGSGPYMSIIETGGVGPEGTHNSTDVPAYVRPSIQLVFRGEDYNAVRALAQSVYDLLFVVRNRFINGTFWRQIRIIQEPMDLLPDDAGRARVVFNIDCVKRPSPATS